ncbi:MAG: hypothetical protein R6V03_04895 [Kiritimatiellia bacterium]
MMNVLLIHTDQQRYDSLGCNQLNRVPFILRLPGENLPAGTAVPMSNTDVMPTVLTSLGIEAPGGIHGVDILPYVRNGDSSRKVMVQAINNFDPGVRNLSLYDKRFRFTWYPEKDERELYDHDNDPLELDNIAGLPEHGRRCEDMLAGLVRMHAGMSQSCTGRVCSW